MGDEDKRFAHVGKDPRFRTMGKQARKVKIDKRFQAMFKDKKFKLKYTVDKRGRPIHTTTNEDLRKFYDLSESDSDDSESEIKKTVKKKNKKNKAKQAKSNSQKNQILKEEPIKMKKEKKKSPSKKLKSKKIVVQDDSEDESTSGIGEEDDQEETELVMPEEESDEDEVSAEENADDEIDGDESDEEEEDEDADSDASSESGDVAQVDLARGEGNISSSDEDEEEYEFEEEKFDHKWNELDKEASEAIEVSSRLAVCNMDWDRIKAEDLLVLFNSFKQTGGIIRKISIYKSEFGKERLAEEDRKGPKELVEHNEGEFNGNDAEGSAYHMEKLRQYQLNRLKYYYAVMECDSKDTANHIYEQCDGTEYESSSTRIDLRFIPDEMEFDDEPTSEIKDMPDTLSYKPTLFNCKALNQSQVELTWDETDQKRTEVLMRKFNKDDLEQMDMKDYLASSSSDDEDPYAGIEVADFLKTANNDEKSHTKGADKYKDILSIAKEDKETAENSDMEMEITWEPGLKVATEDLVEKKKKKGKQTPWEEFLDKKKEKKQKRMKTDKVETQNEGSDAEENGYSDDDIPEGVDLNDPYFKEEMDKLDDEEEEDAEQSKSKREGKKKKKKHKKKNEEDNTNKEEDKQEQAALSLLMMDEDDDKQHFSLSGIQEREKLDGKKKKKRKNKKKIMEQKIQDSFQINVSDPRFASIFENPMYNIDPSAPEYKATKSMEVLAKEKVKRRQESEKHGGKATTAVTKTPKRKMDSEKETPIRDDSLASLVKSVKVKTKTMQSKKSRLK